MLTLLGTEGDTGGAGFVFYNNDDCLGQQFTQAPKQASHDSAGNVLDTGGDFPSAIVSASGRIRAKAIAAGNQAVAGSLYIWTRD